MTYDSEKWIKAADRLLSGASMCRICAGTGDRSRCHLYIDSAQWRADQFGLPRGCLISLFWICTPLIGLTYLTTGRLQKFIEAIMIRYLDVIVAYIMPACDVFIGMSHVYVKSERAATTRYGALTICERGSTHAQFQQVL